MALHYWPLRIEFRERKDDSPWRRWLRCVRIAVGVIDSAVAERVRINLTPLRVVLPRPAETRIRAEVDDRQHEEAERRPQRREGDQHAGQKYEVVNSPFHAVD